MHGDLDRGNRQAAELIPCILIRRRSSLPVQATNGGRVGDPVQCDRPRGIGNGKDCLRAGPD